MSASGLGYGERTASASPAPQFSPHSSMPTRTTVHNWPKRCKDYWAGQRGGRPLPTPAPLPKKGDRLPRDIVERYARAFDSHDEAVAYAKLFDCHARISVIRVWDKDFEIPRKKFVVRP